MLYAADIHINRQIFICFLPGNEFFIILAVHIAEEIPGRTGPLGHRIRLSLSRSAAARTCCVNPLVNTCQR